MALGQNYASDNIFSFGSEDVSLKKGSSPTVLASNSDRITGGYDCNICLDSAVDPVVTLCGHLYCWPCIYKWLQVESSNPGSEETCKCPVCKAPISNSSLVPLYGRETSSTESESKKSQPDFVIPRRPQATLVNSSVNQQLHHRASSDPQQPSIHYRQYFPSAFDSYATLAQGTPMTSLFSPTVGVFGEMFMARIFGTTDTSLFAYAHPSTYTIPGNGGYRMRQAEKSLNRLSMFLFCCIILCLLLF